MGASRPGEGFSLAPLASSLAPPALRESNRVLILRCTRRETKMGPHGPHFLFWRWSESSADDALRRFRPVSLLWRKRAHWKPSSPEQAVTSA